MGTINQRSQQSNARLPVTVLSRFLQAGETTLLRLVLTNRVGLRVAQIVNDVQELNLDQKAIKDAKLVRQDEKLVELSNGCNCCNRRDDLLDEVKELATMEDETAGAGRFKVLLVESTGVNEQQRTTRRGGAGLRGRRGIEGARKAGHDGDRG